MSYFEFNEPYYALVKTHQTTVDRRIINQYVSLYEEHVAKLDGIYDVIKFRNAKGRDVWEDKAFFIFSRAKENEAKSFDELKEIFKEIPFNSIVVLDNALS